MVDAGAVAPGAVVLAAVSSATVVAAVAVEMPAVKASISDMVAVLDAAAGGAAGVGIAVRLVAVAGP